MKGDPRASLDPSGWMLQQRGPRHWWLSGPDGCQIATIIRADDTQWVVQMDHEPLPWGQTYPSTTAAVDAVVTWWRGQTTSL